jgi:hypothetical protein
LHFSLDLNDFPRSVIPNEKGIDKRIRVRHTERNRISTKEFLMAKRGPDTHHVVPNPNGGWDIRKGGGERSSGHFETKSVAIDRAREISRNQATELRIHNRDGRIAQSDSHGGDKYPPKG